MRRLAVMLPLILALALIIIFSAALLSGRNSQTIPSPYLNRAVPSFTATLLSAPNQPPLKSADLTPPHGSVTLLNVWASWCTPCIAEHPYISSLAAEPHIQLAGLNYKDKPDQAQQFLEKYGNPFAHIGVDPNGAAAFELGVYGVPETYLIDHKGIIRYKVVGPVTPELIETELRPLINKLIAKTD